MTVVNLLLIIFPSENLWEGVRIMQMKVKLLFSSLWYAKEDNKANSKKMSFGQKVY